MKIKHRVGKDHREEVITELDYFTIETDNGEFAISFRNDRLRIVEVSLANLSIQPQTSNCVDVAAV